MTTSNPNDWLNDKQYEALQQLYHEFNEAFLQLPEYIKEAFYIRLYSK